MRPSTRAPRAIALALLTAALLGASAGIRRGRPDDDPRPDRVRLPGRHARAVRPGGGRPQHRPQVHILVLPITYSLSADSTTKSERKKNITFADNRRSQIEAACNAVKQTARRCLAELVPVLVRSDAVAFDPAPLLHRRPRRDVRPRRATRRLR